MRGEFDRLARAVISQALSDAGIGALDGERLTVSELARNEARSFLFATVGTWRQAREYWASLADLCPDQLRHRAKAALEGALNPQPAPVPQPITPKRPPKPQERRLRKAPMPGTKLADVLYYLKRAEGVSIEELQRALGWSRQAAQTGIYEMRLYGIVTKRGQDGRYRIVSLP